MAYLMLQQSVYLLFLYFINKFMDKYINLNHEQISLQFQNHIKIYRTTMLAYIISTTFLLNQVISLVTNHTLQPTQSNYTYSETIVNNATNFVSVRLDFTGDKSYTILYASLNGYRSANLSQSFLNTLDLNQNIQILSNIDLEGLRTASSQYINFPLNSSTSTTIYIQVFNIDPNYRKKRVNFQITVDDTKSIPTCKPCQNGGIIRVGNICQCDSCQGSFSGSDCSRKLIQLQQNMEQQYQIVNNEFIFFKIPKLQNNFKVTVELKGRSQAYYQYIQDKNDVASFINYATSSSGNLVLDLVNNNTISITFSPGRNGLSITFAKFVGENSTIKIKYELVFQTNILTIVLAVLGSVLFLILAGGLIFFCIFRQRSNNNEPFNNIILQAQSERLTNQQIQKYFPEVTEESLSKIEMEVSSNNLNLNLNEKTLETQKDCAICLCQISKNQNVRVTYCKHFFHSACLIGWFQKQRNCPYCRQQFNRSKTSEKYQLLVKQNNNRTLKGLQLVQAIINHQSKTHDSTNIKVMPVQTRIVNLQD